jgi:hypothetical protein
VEDIVGETFLIRAQWRQVSRRRVIAIANLMNFETGNITSRKKMT